MPIQNTAHVVRNIVLCTQWRAVVHFALGRRRRKRNHPWGKLQLAIFLNNQLIVSRNVVTRGIEHLMLSEGIIFLFVHIGDLRPTINTERMSRRQLALKLEALLGVGLCIIFHILQAVGLDLEFTFQNFEISNRFGDIVKRGHILTGGIDHLIGRLALHSANVCQRGVEAYLQAVARGKRACDHLITLARQRRTVVNLRRILDRNGHRAARGIDVAALRGDLIARGNIGAVFVVNQNRCDFRMAAIVIIGKGCARQAVGVNQILRRDRRLRAVMHARLAD